MLFRLCLILGALVTVTILPAQECAPLPENFKGFWFSTLDYDSLPDAAGDRLIVGSLSREGWRALMSLPPPATKNQRFCGCVALGPFRAVTAYVPTAQERAGDFSAFGGTLYDPATAKGPPSMSEMQPFSGNVIPMNRRPRTFAWRVAAIHSLPNVVNAARYGVGGAATQPGAVVPLSATEVISEGTGILRGTWSFDFDAGLEGSGYRDSAMDVWWEQMTPTKRGMVPINCAQLANVGVTPFDAVEWAALLGLNYGYMPINGNNDESNLLAEGDVFAVRTNAGNYAKVRVESYGYNLRIRWVTYRGTDSTTP